MSNTQISGDQIEKGKVIAIGNFDGLHLGHQRVIQTACQNGKAALISFAPHPRRFFAKNQIEDFELTTNQQISNFAKRAGADAVHFIKFDQNFSLQTAHDFLESIKQIFAPSLIVVGSDFSFGKGKQGDTEFLKQWGQTNTIPIHIEPLLTIGDKKVSSSLIRQELKEGKPQAAAQLLGRPHTIVGKVAKGDQRGRELGYPTANLYLEKILLPKFGIYATRVKILTGKYAGSYLGASSLGVRPTFGENKPNFETYIIDFEGSIYGETISVELIEYLRPEIKFNDLESLISQMDNDVIKCQEILSEV